MASVFGRLATLGVVALLLQITGLLLFVLGFFPVKPALDGISGAESFLPLCKIDDINELDRSLHDEKYDPQEKNLGLPAKYDRLVFMVVDGLPAEFVLGKDGRPPARNFKSAMSYTQNLLSNGSALGYHAKAAPPTVTMPRLKAMTSGAIAGFLDVAYNFNTQKLLEDNLIGQLARAGWRMVMLGDETWLKLFPNLFERHDGVSSFYVKDTVEVDNNVTRHLDYELENTDWNLLILHYLGLDHVGHLGGRSSPLMDSKLREMDSVIERIHQTVLSKSPLSSRTLVVVVSDHGMTSGGNHGGATYQETDALALFITNPSSKPEFQISPEASASSILNDAAYQVDLVPTLAILLGMPIPKNSVGALLQPLFSSLPPELQLKALELNSWQLLRLMRRRSPHSVCIADICQNQKATDGDMSSFRSKQGDNALKYCTLFNLAVEKRKQWSENGKETSGFEEAKEAYLQFLRPTSEWLASGSTERLTFVFIGGLLMLLSTILFLLAVYEIHKATFEDHSSRREKSRIGTSRLLKLIAVGGVSVHAASFGSSSFVEEEQFTWHFMLSTLLVALVRASLQQFKFENDDGVDVISDPNYLMGENSDKLPADCRVKRKHNPAIGTTADQSRMRLRVTRRKMIINQVIQICLLLVLGRILRSWHRSGVNWTHLPDVAKTLENTYPSVIAYIRAGCLFSVTLMCCWILPKSLPQSIRRITQLCLILSAMLILLYFTCSLLGLTSRADAWDLGAWATVSAQGVYCLVGGSSLLAFATFPWLLNSRSPYKVSSTSQKEIGPLFESVQEDFETSTLEYSVKRSFCATGLVFVSCWSLLQLLLQQSVNAAPIALLLLQLLMAVNLFHTAHAWAPRWISILTLHWLGASGHFGLGNSNTLATVDVAGAYIGLSSHSTVLSGILAFFITYGSPLLYMQGLLLTTSRPRALEEKKISKFLQPWLLEDIILPCILPLAMNSIFLTAFTGVLYVMQDHLFVWSVFSPKYLYAIATTVCTYIGTLVFVAVGGYSILVMSFRIQQTDGVGLGRRKEVNI
ncbi:hypothetical protein Mapa_008618 [Marchantia paleacea]|nr:hypothetical protein Mapa_008618 [Marchantia paleacea]